MKSMGTSYNFAVAKIVAIMIVAMGHFFGGILWIPTTFSLFIFGFSSGYFTDKKYHDKFSLKQFWYAKILRIIPSIILINFFLTFVFIIQGKSKIICWQSIITITGLSGFLTWFGIPNPSPYGHGLWFFTLLIIFYLVYPFLRTFRYPQVSIIVVLIITYILKYFYPMGHALWLTAYSFFAGCYFSYYEDRMLLPSPLMSILLFFFFNFFMFILNMFNFNKLNYFLMTLSCFAIAIYLIKGRTPSFLRVILPLSKSIIYIYFLHTYLFLHDLTGIAMVDFFISMILIVVVSFFLANLEHAVLRKNLLHV